MNWKENVKLLTDDEVILALFIGGLAGFALALGLIGVIG